MPEGICVHTKQEERVRTSTPQWGLVCHNPFSFNFPSWSWTDAVCALSCFWSWQDGYGCWSLVSCVRSSFFCEAPNCYAVGPSIFFFIFLLYCQKIPVLARERKGEKKRERNHSLKGYGHATIPSPFLHPVRALGMHVHVPGVFYKLPGQGSMWDLAPFTTRL